MAEPLRHRQTKEAETDMFSLKPPRHISTLPEAAVRCDAAICPVLGVDRTLAEMVKMALLTPFGHLRSYSAAIAKRSFRPTIGYSLM
jgi:hypothetical protein